MKTSSYTAAIAAKKLEIANYEVILQKYRANRWYDQGRRHLAELKRELEALAAAAPWRCRRARSILKSRFKRLPAASRVTRRQTRKGAAQHS